MHGTPNATTPSQAAPATPAAPTVSGRVASRLRVLGPGLVLCLAAAGASYAVGLALPGVSPLIVAIVLGVIAANTGLLPAATGAGIDFSAKKLLRVGIVFLGLQLVLGDILSLGAPMLLVIVAVVTGGLLGTLGLGRLLRVPAQLTLLIACGFSICGAAAVAGAAGVTDPDDEHEQHTVTAVALVVIFGTIMIPLVPLVAPLIGLGHDQSGMWAGASIHEIAQVVAVGGVLGGTALTLAVVVKLARVLLLAPVLAVLSVRIRRARIAERSAARPSTSGPSTAGPSAAGLSAAETAVDGSADGPAGQPGAPAAPAARTVAGSAPKLPPIVPPFIIGFLAMVLLRSFVPLPEAVLTAGQTLQTVLLAAAMFGLGCGVRVRSLARVGLRPFALAGLATLLVAGIAYVGVLLAA